MREEEEEGWCRWRAVLQRSKPERAAVINAATSPSDTSTSPLQTPKYTSDHILYSPQQLKNTTESAGTAAEPP